MKGEDTGSSPDGAARQKERELSRHFVHNSGPGTAFQTSAFSSEMRVEINHPVVEGRVLRDHGGYLEMEHNPNTRDCGRPSQGHGLIPFFAVGFGLDHTRGEW